MTILQTKTESPESLTPNWFGGLRDMRRERQSSVVEEGDPLETFLPGSHSVVCKPSFFFSNRFCQESGRRE
jgi:hypothetical protein